MERLAIEQQGIRMEDKQTKFQLAPAAHMKAQVLEVNADVAKLVKQANDVKLALEGFCRAGVLGQDLTPFTQELEKLLASAKAAGAAPKKRAATSKRTSTSSKEESSGEASDE